jgi:hypothetical protein
VTTRRSWDTPASPSTDKPPRDRVGRRAAAAGGRSAAVRPMLAGFLLIAGTVEARAADQGAAAEPRPPAARKVYSAGPAGEALEIAAGPGSIIGRDELLLKEYVDIRTGTTRLQADMVRYVPATRQAEATGNVVLDFGGARITADRIEYNLGTGAGTFHQARGYAEPSYYFEAERIEKISETELVLYEATFSACTQPIPYWSFKVGHGLLRLDDYAYLHNMSFRIGRVPIFYSPYLVWPIKTDRSAGLLFPEFGFSQRNGTVISNAFYWPMRRNMDATLFLDYMSHAGYGSGLEYRYVPTVTGRGYFTAYYIRDQIAKDQGKIGVSADRWVMNFGHNQDFASGWRLVGNANFISDFDYYLDFERDLRLSTTPQAISNLSLTRNWGFYALNLSGERREQLIRNFVVVPNSFVTTFEQETITRWIQPEVELRGTRRRLGRAPLYLSFESSAAWFDKGTTDASYQRFDAFPVLSSQLSPVPWFDVDVNAGVRGTYYTKSQVIDLGCDNTPGTNDYGEDDSNANFEDDEDGDGQFTAADDDGCDDLPGSGDYGEGNGMRDIERSVSDPIVLSDSLGRYFAQGGVTLIGPKVNRVFDTPDSEFSPQFKHTFEPQIRYTYRSDVDEPTRAIPFDEIDAIPTRQSRITYALVTRLYAKRPVDATVSQFGVQPLATAGQTGVGAGSVPFGAPLVRPQGYGDEPPPGAAGQPPADDAGKKALSTVEIATLEISQDYSLLGPLSRSAALGTPLDPVLESNLSPVRAVLRFNPTTHAGFDLRTSFDILFRQIREASLSANLRSIERGFLDVTWSLVRDLEGEALFGTQFDRSQIGFVGETNFLNRRLLVGMQINYELGDVSAGEPRLRDQRYKVGYNTQCCGFQVEYLNRNFADSHQNEFRFLVNLRGVGNVVDLHSGNAGALPGAFPTF